MNESNTTFSNFQINDKKKFKIFIKGAKVHNLKNIDVEIPKNQLVVVTGVSGSGKSSLTIDTLFAEGQRRYVESLSSYARQFLTRMDKPDVDYIHGLCPAIAIEQKTTTRTTRSTVGSLTEIFDYLRLFFARIGKTHSPVSGSIVSKHQVSDVIDSLKELKEGTKVYITFPLADKSKKEEDLTILFQKGFNRLWFNNEVIDLEELLNSSTLDLKNAELFVLVDRIVYKENDEDLVSRISDSVETCFKESKGQCIIFTDFNKKIKQTEFNGSFEADGIVFEEPTPDFFNFNNPYGACKTCEGFGTVMGLDEDLIFPDKNLSIYEGGIAPWRGEKMSEWVEPLIKKGILFDFPIHRAIKDLTKKEKELIWKGNEYFNGLNYFFKYLEEKSYKIQYRVMLSRFKGKTACPDCNGSRIRKDALYVIVNDKNIGQLLQLPIIELKSYFDKLKLKDAEKKIAERIFSEINNRIDTLLEVGLGYLTLNRMSNTLSGGETQRINLTRSIGSNLTGSLYILDEPSIGLHQKDTFNLIKVLKKLKNLGNTVIIVEHDEDIMMNADHIIDVGPEAGINGGQIVYNGPASLIKNQKNGFTSSYLNGKMEVKIPDSRRKPINYLEIKGARQHNLKDISVKIPLNALTVVCGVSGSGKSTLIRKILYPALEQLIGDGGEKPGEYDSIMGPWKLLKQVEMIDQNPLGRSSRSNPVTYVKAYDYVRDLLARQSLSKQRGYQPKDFSFNVEGGRCEECKGEGEIVVEMQFLADVHLKCESCNGKKFKEDVLEVTYKGKNVYEILELSISEALDFFNDHPEIYGRIKPLVDVGLGYVKMGQSNSTLSGGEAQRVKLASFLTKGASKDPVFFIFDEPTTGLHFHDINKLMFAFQALINAGHTVLVIEHNMDVIKCADYLLELGPVGGNEGGYLIYEGAPEGLLKIKNSPTSDYLREKIK